jgi:uncharacterized membrane protein YccC
MPVGEHRSAFRVPRDMLQIIQQFGWRDGLFSVKTFLAAMLALYIAFRLGLSQPGWSLTTVYIVSQPLAGMVLAKSLYRMLGTLIGAAMSLVLVALFSNAPELFCLALAVWIGLGTFVSIYLRDAPQSYVGMLSGYSAAIIGLPAAIAPDTAFDFAVARCLEIMLGIACGALMHHVVFPQRAGDALRKALDATLPSMARWANDALRGEGSEAKGLLDRRQIISAVVALDGLRVFASLDTPALRAVDDVIRQFEGKLMSLLALLMSVYDRFGLLQCRGSAAADRLRPLLVRAAAYITDSAGVRTLDEAHRETEAEVALKAVIDAELPSSHALRTDPEAFLVRSILLRLGDLLALWRGAVSIRMHIALGLHPPDNDPAPAFHPYRDVTLAVVGALVSAITVVIASGFWILTAWPNGPTAVTFAGIMCAIMGGRDDPAAASAVFLTMTVAGIVVAGFYLFAVLPALSTFAALVIALAPFYLVCGLLLTSPATVPFAMPLIFVGGGLISFSNAMTYDFAAFINSAIAYVAGIGIGAVSLGLLRPLGAEWAVKRLTRGLLRELAHISGSATTEPRSAFESRMFDRINALFMRLDPLVGDQRAVLQGCLAGLRIGLNILVLRGLRPALPSEAASSVQDALTTLADHFGALVRHRYSDMPLSVLAAARGRILARGEDPALTRAAEALYNIEATLRQHTDFFGPVAPAAPAPATDLVTP